MFFSYARCIMVCVIKQLRDLCIDKPTYSKVKTANVNPNISQRMRFGQISTSVIGEGRRRTVADINKIPIELRPKPSIIVPLTNF